MYLSRVPKVVLRKILMESSLILGSLGLFFLNAHMLTSPNLLECLGGFLLCFVFAALITFNLEGVHRWAHRARVRGRDVDVNQPDLDLGGPRDYCDCLLLNRW